MALAAVSLFAMSVFTPQRSPGLHSFPDSWRVSNAFWLLATLQLAAYHQAQKLRIERPTEKVTPHPESATEPCTTQVSIRTLYFSHGMLFDIHTTI